MVQLAEDRNLELELVPGMLAEVCFNKRRKGKAGSEEDRHGQVAFVQEKVGDGDQAQSECREVGASVRQHRLKQP